jgi:hypothetical protein
MDIDRCKSRNIDLLNSQNDHRFPKNGFSIKPLPPQNDNLQPLTIWHHYRLIKAINTNAMKIFFTLPFIIALALAGNNIYAQTCNGELMKFQETFGTGNRAELAYGRTNYHYNGSTALTDGDYTLLKTTQAKPEWHISGDHTGDVNGRMMVTNASFAPGEFYRDTVYGVSSVSTYNIYFYAMNVNTVGTCSPNPILPQLQLIVESYNFDGTFTQIYSMVSTSLPQTTTPTWVKVSGQFYLPTECTAVRYRIINNSTGGCGNDLAIDDITFSQCLPVILPVSGLTLKGASNGQSAALSWSTLSEINTDKFTIEKSNDEKVWKAIATVKAAGQSSTRKEYTFQDNNPYALNFYRIVSVDENGQSIYSNRIVIRSVASDGGQMTAYPNPFTSVLKIEMISEKNQYVSLRMFDINGKLVRSIPWLLKAGINSFSIDGVSNLTPGMYFINATDMSRVVLCKTKVLKQ